MATIGGGFLNIVGGVSSTIGGGCRNNATGSYSTIVGGLCNNDNSLSKVVIAGSNITADRVCSTFVNNLSIKNIPSSSAGLPSGSIYRIGNSVCIVI
jgi:hypothetical protein